MNFDFPADYYTTATINPLTAIDRCLPIFLSQLHRWLLKLKPFRLKLLTLLRKSFLIRSPSLSVFPIQLIMLFLVQHNQKY